MSLGMFVRAVAVLVVAAAGASAQSQAMLVIEVRFNAMPVADATIVINGATHLTGPEGTLTIAVASGTIEVRVAKSGFATAATTVTVTEGQRQAILVELQEQPTV